jgi:hypothetical protein
MVAIALDQQFGFTVGLSSLAVRVNTIITAATC